MHEFTFNGTAICSTYGLILTEYSETPPEPKVYTIEVPYGQDIDISDSVNGVAFHDRKHVVGLFYTGGKDQSDFEAKASQIYSALDGKRGEYSFSWDWWEDASTPPVRTYYTYTGRIKVASVEFMGFGSGLIKLEITASPYKLKERMHKAFTFDSAATVTLSAGRKRVSPTITTDGNVFVEYGPTVYLNAGVWNVADLVIDGSQVVTLYAAGTGTDAILNDYWADTLNDLKNNTLASLYTKAGTVTEQRTVAFDYEWSEL